MLPSTDWYVTSRPGEIVRLFHINHYENTVNIPVSVSKTLIVRNDTSWVCVFNGFVVPRSCPILNSIPHLLLLNDFSSLLTCIINSSLCPGNNDKHFVDLCNIRKGQFLSLQKDVVAFIDKSNLSLPTVRHSSCHIVVNNEKRCAVCNRYRNVLRAIYSSSKKSSNVLPKTNYRFLNTPQRIRQKTSLRNKVKNLVAKNKRLKEKLTLLTEQAGVEIDPSLQSDFLAAVNINQQEVNTLPYNDFKRIFWEQQVGFSCICM